MCGIVGSINFSLDSNRILDSMLHRGPDQQHSLVEDNVQLFHLRLSILDIEGGKQPMGYLDRYTIIFNGEIYNHNQLRDKFKLEGKSHSDTETLLLLYHSIGVKMLNELDGMFAFAIYDKYKKELFIARDRAGKKPLYIYKESDALLFASELNCIHSLVRLQMNKNNFLNYLRFGSFYRAQTPYKNVSELLPGSYFLVDTVNMSIIENKWWNIIDHYQNKSSDSFETAMNKVELYFDNAIKNRIESSDLEVGSFLSGGIDSGLTTAFASKYKSALKTFTVSFPGAYNEGDLAKLVANKYSTVHTEIPISFSNLKNDIESILTFFGEPFFDSSAIPSYYVSREAKKHLTVVINGDGADELFAGYRRYIPFSKYDFFAKGETSAYLAKLAKRLLPLPTEKKSKYNYFYRLLALASKNGLEQYLSAGVDIFEDYEQHFIIQGESYLSEPFSDFSNIISLPITSLGKIMALDFITNLPNDLLVKMDIATMANSLEGRSPFLCKELLEYIPTIDDSYKIKGTTTKYILRKLAQKYLPSELINQPKRGFEVPLKNWVNNELKEPINDYLQSSNVFYKELIDKKFVEMLINNKVKIPDEKRAKMLWTLFSMEVWYKKNI